MNELLKKLSQVYNFFKENKSINLFDAPGNNPGGGDIEFNFKEMEQAEAVETEEGFDFSAKEVVKKKGLRFMAAKLSEHKADQIREESEQNHEDYMTKLGEIESRYKKDIKSLLNIDVKNRTNDLFNVYNRLQRSYEKTLFFADLSDAVEAFQNRDENGAREKINTLLGRTDKYFLTVGEAERDLRLAAEGRDKNAAQEKLALAKLQFEKKGSA